MVIKNTFLSNSDNASKALRKELLESCNLHTVLDCPSGTFLGAGVKTVVLFFEKGAPTRKTWYYQLDPGRNMGKTNPLSDDDRTLADAIEYEAHLLADIRMLADLVIDTSSLDVHTLRNLIRQRVARRDVNLSLLIESFGYKNGLPRDADLVFDVRALPNPHWHNELRPLTGRDERIAEFLRGHPESELMLEDIFHFLNRWLPTYAANDRSYVTVAVGCTGGRHRSVYITEQLAHRLRNQGVPLHVRHRELDG